MKNLDMLNHIDMFLPQYILNTNPKVGLVIIKIKNVNHENKY